MPKNKRLFRGEMCTLSEIIKKSGKNINYQTLASRLNREKMSLERALSQPVKKIKQNKFREV